MKEHSHLNLSICTANVNSLHRAPDGHAGKVQYLREQFKRLNRVVHKTPRILLVRGDSAYWTGWLLVHMVVFRWAQENSSGRISVKLPINVATQSSPMSSWTTTHLQELLMGVMSFVTDFPRLRVQDYSEVSLKHMIYVFPAQVISTRGPELPGFPPMVTTSIASTSSQSQQPYKNDARCRKRFLSSIWDMEIGTTQPPA